MSRMEYSVLKEKMKDNECGWSKTNHTGGSHNLLHPCRVYFPGKATRSGVRDCSRDFPISPRLLQIQMDRGPPGKLLWRGTRRRPFLARREQEWEGKGDGRCQDLDGRCYSLRRRPGQGRGCCHCRESRPPRAGSLRRRGWCWDGGGPSSHRCCREGGLPALHLHPGRRRRRLLQLAMELRLSPVGTTKRHRSGRVGRHEGGPPSRGL
jgi:hypothetical protein